MPFIDGDISDLFFNTDHDEACEHDAHGQFTGFNEGKLRDDAQMFLNCLGRLGVTTPTVEDLLTDFHARI